LSLSYFEPAGVIPLNLLAELKTKFQAVTTNVC